MECILDKRACQAIDGGISLKFDRVTYIPRASGMYIQGVDKSKSLLVEHYVDKMLFKSYNGQGEPFTIPHTKYTRLSVSGADQVSIKIQGALMRIGWGGSDIFLERSIYLLKPSITSLEHSSVVFSFTMPFSLFSLINKPAVKKIEITSRNKEVSVCSYMEGRITLESTVSTSKDISCSFTIEKDHLETLPRGSIYTTATFSVDRHSMVLLSLEGFGVVTSITMACDVEFFNGS
ncbi:hypothetical protein NEFER03_1102 [Nematocida sp. LUAm3]|nr:hypothetical protein NEFER03_1102 [Nematocida sp. LUAm3]KAI5175293.1 hypothetical protein NEFER02_1222 [Nematocida sp. LUAm2]KAI5177750.1 hypothetical protein NEFER01_0974 [Nematocida sp. LUAm1]